MLADAIEAKELNMDEEGGKFSVSAFDSTTKVKNAFFAGPHSNIIDDAPNPTRLMSARTVNNETLDIAAQR